MAADVFLSHATEDKASFVRPLAEKLRAMGLDVWYDEFSIKPGKGLRQAIDAGLADARFAVVILSKSYFKKPWVNWELDGAIQRHLADPNGIIIPIWRGVTLEEVRAFSPPLANLLSIDASIGVDAVAKIVFELTTPVTSEIVKLPKAPNVEDKKVRDAIRKSLAAITVSIEMADGSNVRASIYVKDGDSLTSVKEGDKSLKIRPQGLTNCVARTKRTIAVSNTNGVSPWSGRVKASYPQPQIFKSFLGVPIMDDSGKALGVMAFSSHEGSYFNEERVKMASIIVEMLAPAIAIIARQ